jgi:intergrase/recombinase
MIISNILTGDIVLNCVTNDSTIKQHWNNPLMFDKQYVEDNGLVILCSGVRLTSEVSLLTNPNASKMQVAKALKLITDNQKITVKQVIDQAHAWTNMDSELMQHLGFEERQERSYILHL